MAAPLTSSFCPFDQSELTQTCWLQVLRAGRHASVKHGPMPVSPIEHGPEACLEGTAPVGAALGKKLMITRRLGAMLWGMKSCRQSVPCRALCASVPVPLPEAR